VASVERVETYPDGTVKSRGRWLGEQMVGIHRGWHANGVLSWEEDWSDGTRSGWCSYWYPDGKLLARGVYERGWKSGVWVQYYENGSLMSQGCYSVELNDGKPRKSARVGYWEYRDLFGCLAEEAGFYVGDERVR